MTISELKEYIYKENKIRYILEQVNCHEIKYNNQKKYFSAAFPDGDNPMGIIINNNEYLGCYSYSRTKDFEDNVDLITLIQYIKNVSFIEAIKWLHNILEIPFKLTKKTKQKKQIDCLDIFKRQLRSNKKVVNVDDIQVLSDKVLNDYVPLLHIDFLREGIMSWTRDKFNLAYSYKHSRIVIPHKYWLTGELLGFNMRTTVLNWYEFGIKKYYLTNGYNKSLNIYGLYENYEAIQKAGYVVVMESEKSVLKRDSLCDSTVVALSGKTLSDEQVRILLGLNVEVVIGLDKDVDINEIRHMCSKFYRTKPISYIYDKWDLLEDKSSPADANNKIYEFLFKYRVKYDEFEHREYLNSLKIKSN